MLKNGDERIEMKAKRCNDEECEKTHTVANDNVRFC